MVDKVKDNSDFDYLRLEILARIETLKEEIVDMGAYIEDDLKDEDVKR